MSSRTWLVVLVLLGLTWQTRQYARVWQSDLTLWTHAMRRAPLKPRVLNNYGVHLVTAGRMQEARALFLRADLAARAPYRPVWDQRWHRALARANLAALTQLEARIVAVSTKTGG